jgi:hypothetical protein
MHVVTRLADVNNGYQIVNISSEWQKIVAYRCPTDEAAP